MAMQPPTPEIQSVLCRGKFSPGCQQYYKDCSFTKRVLGAESHKKQHHWHFEEGSCGKRSKHSIRSCSPSVPWDTVSTDVWELKHKSQDFLTFERELKKRNVCPRKGEAQEKRQTSHRFKKNMYVHKTLGKLCKKRQTLWKDFSSHSDRYCHSLLSVPYKC